MYIVSVKNKNGEDVEKPFALHTLDNFEMWANGYLSKGDIIIIIDKMSIKSI